MTSIHLPRGTAVASTLACICACLLEPGLSPAASAQTGSNVAWVDDDGVQAKANHITGAFKTIPDAIHAVGPGGTVYVLPGLYNSTAIISLMNGKSLIAMLDATHPVNPNNDPTIANWPVVIENDTGNGIESFGGQQNITVQGFYIRRAGNNGIHVQGQVSEVYSIGPNGKKTVTSVTINSLCNHIYIFGNRIESTYMDGVKVNACNDVHIVGNLIRYTSGITAVTGQMEQAVDFMLSGNSEVRGNEILDNSIGVVVKGGSVNMSVTDNNISGPFLWVAQSGEPVGAVLPYSSATSPQPWGVKDLVVTGNVLHGGPNIDVAVDGCQSCSYFNNALGGNGFLIRADSTGVTKDLCIEDAAPITDKSGGVSIATSNCPTSFPQALIVPGTPGGIDIRPAN